MSGDGKVIVNISVLTVTAGPLGQFGVSFAGLAKDSDVQSNAVDMATDMAKRALRQASHALTTCL